MPDISQQLAAHLANYPEIVLAILFGSQVNGAARGDSDIDLGILGNRPLSDTFKKELIESLALALNIAREATSMAQLVVDFRQFAREIKHYGGE